MKLIINADDFGMSSAVNAAIRESFHQRLISSTTLMVNMPGFEEAIEMMLSDSIFQNRVGIHLNLFEGVPLTEAMRKNLLYCNEQGEYRFLQGHIPFMAPRKIFGTIIYDELKAQIEKALSAGLKPTHLDSHGHYHSNWFVGQAVITLAKEYHIPFIRTSPNLAQISWKKKIFNLIFNRRLRLEKNGLKKCDFMGNISEFRLNINHLNGWCEMMVHPKKNENGVIIDAEFQKPLKDLLDFLNEIELFSYSSMDC